MPWDAAQVRLLHAVVEGKSTKIPLATAQRMLAEQAGHRTVPKSKLKRVRRYRPSEGSS